MYVHKCVFYGNVQVCKCVHVTGYCMQMCIASARFLGFFFNRKDDLETFAEWLCMREVDTGDHYEL